MEPGQNKNGGSGTSSTTPAGGSSSTGTSQAAGGASSTAPRSTAKQTTKGRTSGTQQDTQSINSSRDTSGAFAARGSFDSSSGYAEEGGRSEGRNRGASASADREGVTAAGARVRNDARQLAESISTFTTQAQEVVTKTLDERPYVALGTAFGIGYLLGGGLRSKLTGLALTIGGRYLLNNMGSQLLGQVRR